MTYCLSWCRAVASANAHVPRHSNHPHRHPHFDGRDKVVHLITFAALSFPLARTGRFGLTPVFVGASAFGGLIELIQPSFNRSADMSDWVADIMGVVLGIIICGLIYRRLRPH